MRTESNEREEIQIRDNTNQFLTNMSNYAVKRHALKSSGYLKSSTGRRNIGIGDCKGAMAWKKSVGSSDKKTNFATTQRISQPYMISKSGFDSATQLITNRQSLSPPHVDFSKVNMSNLVSSRVSLVSPKRRTTCQSRNARQNYLTHHQDDFQKPLPHDFIVNFKTSLS